MKETLTNVGIPAGGHWKRSAQVGVRLVREGKTHIKAIKYMIFSIHSAYVF